MGIDIEFYVDPGRHLTTSEFFKLKQQFHRTFREASQTVDDIDGIYDPETDQEKRMLRLNTMCRYYGKGYERGNPGPWIEFAEFFESLGFTCYYFGDCSAFDETTPPFDAASRKELLAHFQAVGNEPYRSSFR